MFSTTPSPRIHGASAEAIKAYCSTNFHETKPHRGVCKMCGMLVARVQEGQEIRLGDFIRYYSSLLDAFEVEQVVEIGDDHITLLWIDGDGRPPNTHETRYEGKRGRWWSAADNIWKGDGECYSLWRAVDLVEAAKSCRRPHLSEYIPFMSGGQGPRSYVKRDVYTQQFQQEDWAKLKEAEPMTALALTYSNPAIAKPTLWQRVIGYVADKFI